MPGQLCGVQLTRGRAGIRTWCSGNPSPGLSAQPRTVARVSRAGGQWEDPKGTIRALPSPGRVGAGRASPQVPKMPSSQLPTLSPSESSSLKRRFLPRGGGPGAEDGGKGEAHPGTLRLENTTAWFQVQSESNLLRLKWWCAQPRERGAGEGRRRPRPRGGPGEARDGRAGAVGLGREGAGAHVAQRRGRRGPSTGSHLSPAHAPPTPRPKQQRSRTHLTVVKGRV